jgi:DNA-binding HxlR family transcriptional regulator
MLVPMYDTCLLLASISILTVVHKYFVYTVGMLDHHLQRSIVYRLALSHELRFSELKPDTIDNKLFTYHLHKVEQAGLVAKNDDGLYSLTPEGRRLGIRVFEKQQALIDRAESVLFLAIRRRSDNSWLLYKRKVHPLIDRTGFMHATPNATESVVETAQKVCLEKTGLRAEFKVLGSGYFRVFEDNNLESFTHFTLLSCENTEGNLIQNDEYATYYWEQQPNFSDPSMLPNMPTLTDCYRRGRDFFIEKTLHI